MKKWILGMGLILLSSSTAVGQLGKINIDKNGHDNSRSLFINIDYVHRQNAGGLTKAEVRKAVVKDVSAYNNLLEKDSINFTLKVRWGSSETAHAWVSPDLVEKDWVLTRLRVQNLNSDDFDTWESLIYGALPVNSVPFIKIGSSGDFAGTVNKISISEVQEGAIFGVSIPTRTLTLNTGTVFGPDFEDLNNSGQSIDLVAAITHEIEHLLGFQSGLASSHGGAGTRLSFWDVFRLNNGLTTMSSTKFRTANRELRKEPDGSITNAAAVLHIGIGWPQWFKQLSAGGTSPTGALYMADHWADRQVAQEVVGLVEPRAIWGEFHKYKGSYLYPSDIRAIDIMGCVINENGWDDVGPPAPVSPVQDSMHDPSQNLLLTWSKDPEATTSDVFIYDLGVASIQRLASNTNGSLVYRKNNVATSFLEISNNDLSLIPGHKYQWHAAVYQPLGFQRTDFATFIVAGEVGPIAPCAGQFESAKLLQSRVAPENVIIGFNESVSIDGDIAVVGVISHTEDGRVYVYRRDGSRWIEETILSPSDINPTINPNYFGGSVSVDGNVIVVGADSASGGLLPDSDTAYVFRHDGVSWVQEQQLFPSDISTSREFGNSVAVSGGRIIVGAPRTDGVVNDSGAAYIFDYNGSSWVETSKLVATDGEGADLFGTVVDVSGDKVVVGARHDDDLSPEGGSAYIFSWDGTSWSQEVKLIPDDGSSLSKDSFGVAVSIENDVVVIGACGGARSLNYTPITPGKVYVFRYTNSVWSQEANLQPPVVVDGDGFGVSVSISGDVIVAGAAFTDGNNLSESGSVFAYQYKDGNWMARNRMERRVERSFEWYGLSVDISGDTIIGGAPIDFTNEELVGGAYIHEFNPCPVDLVEGGGSALNFFDVSEFLVQFNTQTQLGDWNCDGVWNAFDVLGYTADFQAGCP